jgi:hypothetical protein
MLHRLSKICFWLGVRNDRLGEYLNPNFFARLWEVPTFYVPGITNNLIYI